MHRNNLSSTGLLEDTNGRRVISPQVVVEREFVWKRQGKQGLGGALTKSSNLSFTSVSSFTDMQTKLVSEGEFDKVTHVLADKGNSCLEHAILYVVKVSTRIFIV